MSPGVLLVEVEEVVIVKEKNSEVVSLILATEAPVHLLQTANSIQSQKIRIASFPNMHDT
jgi:hypothetical protein